MLERNVLNQIKMRGLTIQIQSMASLQTVAKSRPLSRRHATKKWNLKQWTEESQLRVAGWFTGRGGRGCRAVRGRGGKARVGAGSISWTLGISQDGCHTMSGNNRDGDRAGRRRCGAVRRGRRAGRGRWWWAASGTRSPSCQTVRSRSWSFFLELGGPGVALVCDQISVIAGDVGMVVPVFHLGEARSVIENC
jgi:hypothetical protein